MDNSGAAAVGAGADGPALCRLITGADAIAMETGGGGGEAPPPPFPPPPPPFFISLPQPPPPLRWQPPRGESSPLKPSMLTSNISLVWLCILASNWPGCSKACSCCRADTSSLFASSIMSLMAFTWSFTAESFSLTDTAPLPPPPLPSAPPPPPPPASVASSYERRSALIWKSTKSSIKSCASLISLANESGGRLRTRSSCGFTCTTHTANSVLLSWSCLKARAKRCCSGLKLATASRKAFGVGSVDSSRGTLNSSRFCTTNAAVGSSVLPSTSRPTRTTNDENCRARHTSDGPPCPCPWCWPL
mmetsp:Transcript_58273/g.109815  ORF Transcript_58273/g.109815 Transcript_58273/m.109815 type:complete len:304 (+) Transcript_58273:883-1794(+)